jgi:phosphoribosyl 1,2-cyclic phosphate phosphodiesterase
MIAVELLGTGASHGIPVLGCECARCHSTDPRDTRTRASALIRFPSGKDILIDPTPDFRIQALRSRVRDVRNVLITQARPDRIFGFDDLRPFTICQPVEMFASPPAAADFTRRCPYAFGGSIPQVGGGVPVLSIVAVTGKFELTSIAVDPIPMNQGEVTTYGYRLGNFAYLSDGNYLSDEGYEKLAGVELLVVSTVGPKESRAHFSFAEAVAVIERIHPRRAWFTFISHCVTHAAVEAWIADTIRERAELAGIEIFAGYDRLVIDGISI